MYFRVKVREAVIRQNEIAVHAIPLLHTRIDLANKLIKPLIPALHNVHSIVKEHMLYAVQVIEDRGKHTLAEIIHQVIKDLDTAIENGCTQRQKLIVSD